MGAVAKHILKNYVSIYCTWCSPTRPKTLYNFQVSVISDSQKMSYLFVNADPQMEEHTIKYLLLEKIQVFFQVRFLPQR